MRKAILTFVGIMVAMMASAYTAVSFKAGDPSVLLKKSTASFEVDYSKLRVTNHENIGWDAYLRKRGDDFVRDWPGDRLKVESYFTERFNRKSDWMRIVQGQGEYKMVLRIATLDVGNGGSLFNPWASAKAGGVVMNGTIEIRDGQTDRLLCELNVIDAKGAGHPSETVRLGLSFNEAAGDMCDFIEDDVERGKVKATPIAGDAYAGTAAAQPEAQQAAPQAAGNGGEAVVTLKNGTVLRGQLKSFDPLTQVVMTVGGHDVTIPMSQVKDVATSNAGSAPAAAAQSAPAPKAASHAVAEEEVSAPATSSRASTDTHLGNRKLIVTDNGSYPESFRIKVGGQMVNMVLVRGGHMNMGYDGNGSRRMKSEPVHEVAVTSFYISDMPLEAQAVLPIVGDKNVDGEGSEPAQVRGFDDVEKVIAHIAQQTGKNYRLPTEAEWEFAACGDMQNTVFSIARGRNTAYEWCDDWLDYYSDSREVVTDPTGPARGDQHVIRAYNGKRGKFDRSSDIDEDDAYLGLVRLVIKAKDYQR